MMGAAYNGNLEIIKYLLKYNPIIDNKDIVLFF